jgi:hypothetical protein
LSARRKVRRGQVAGEAEAPDLTGRRARFRYRDEAGMVFAHDLDGRHVHLQGGGAFLIFLGIMTPRIWRHTVAGLAQMRDR